MATPADAASQTQTDATSTRTLGQLVSDVSTDITHIMRGEIELAKAEIKQDVTHAGKGAGLLAGSALFGLYGLGLLLLGLAGVIAIWLSWWAGLLIVAGVLFVVAAILALVGRKALQRVKGKPQRAIDQAQETVDSLKGAAQSPHRSEIQAPTAPDRDGATATLR